MRSVIYISGVSGLLFFTIQVKAQTTLHADPRLSVLVKKPHSIEQAMASAAVAKSKKIAKASVSATSTAVQSTVPYTPPSATSQPTDKTKPLAYVAGTSKPDPAIKPMAGEKGHAAGWTPPVHRKARAVYSGKGFRVQIYNGPDRDKAIAVKTEFMRMYPGVRTYLTYMSPSFRVKVGDYRNRSDAVGMFKEANSVYNPSMIVPDIITISTF
ncbi:MAG: hypothetical protein K0Q79_3423 [Flavipsychrobacter sp.]|jgi:hypothetical protein|nr:hypothetical protein [Flavipsychrobacter sp.]